MRITVTLHSTLRKFLPAGAGNSTVVDLDEGATVADAISRLGIPPGHAKIIVSADGQLEPTSTLCDAQEIDVFPPLAGGL